jgi:hypothetical protein
MERPHRDQEFLRSRQRQVQLLFTDPATRILFVRLEARAGQKGPEWRSRFEEAYEAITIQLQGLSSADTFVRTTRPSPTIV